jgi:polyvinyl alcohol dehydrogenase (cytochrome)
MTDWMSTRGLPRIVALCLVGGAAHVQAQPQAQDGAGVFQTVCAQCHRDGAADAPSPATLRSLPVQTILTALESGKMQAVGVGLNAAQRQAVAKYLGVAGVESIAQSAYCTGAQPSAKNEPTWNAWGIDAVNSRFQPAKEAGLTGKDVPRLKLKWAFGFPGVTTAFGTPTVFGGRVIVGSQDGTVYSLNARSGCIYWMYKATDGVRTGSIISSDGQTVFLSDLHAWVHSLNANTGALLWKAHVDEHPEASITGTPKLDGDRLYVPVAGGDEEVAAGSQTFVCCKFRGSMVALDAKTGMQIWKSYTIAEPAKMTGRTAAGVEIWGPAGASAWSSPTIDSKSGSLYFATGVNYTQPGTKTSDAVIALEMNTGRMLWSRQMIEGDVYNFGCVTDQKANCPSNPGKDLDIGSPPMLKSLGGGRRILVVASKSGVVYGLDPDQQGKILWQTKVSEGGTQGGVIWGGSSNDKTAYFSISDWNPAKPETGGGVVALDIASGKKLWSTPAPRPACLSVKGCSAAQPGATSLIPGAVFAGSLDGHLRAYATGDGHILWDFDTMRDFDTVNGVKARGGAINGTGPAIAGGIVYSNAGYSRFPVMGGNVFLAFSVDGK